MQGNQKRAEQACQEALDQMSQGKLVQPRRLLEATLKHAPGHLPTRLALVELAIKESKPERAVKEAKRATSIALLRCREAGVARGDYAAHPTGQLLLQALHAGAHAHLAAGETGEAINALAVILHEDSVDELNAGRDLIQIFFDQRKPEGVIGLYRLGYTSGLNLLDTVLAALMTADAELTVNVFVDVLERVPEAPAVFRRLAAPEGSTRNPPDEIKDARVVAYLASGRDRWRQVAGARLLLRRLIEHTVVERTLDLLDELEESAAFDHSVGLSETRTQLFANLKTQPVLAALTRVLVE